MQLIGPRLQFHQDGSPAGAGAFRSDPAYLHLELLHRFHSDVLHETLQTGGCIRAIHHYVLRHILRTGNVSAPVAAVGGRHIAVDEIKNVPATTEIQREIG